MPAPSLSSTPVRYVSRRGRDDTAGILAKRSASQGRVVKRPPAALVAVLTTVGFLLVVTGSATSVANQSEEPRRTALVDRIMSERQNVDDLDQAVSEVRSQLDAAMEDAGRISQEQAEANRDRQQLALLAGTTPVRGSGITIKLADAPSRQPGDSKFDASRIQDGDLQLIVNALFAIGAEAVAINDNRVVSVTPIRAAGGTIVVNYRPISSPYRVVAIGVDKDGFEDTDIAEHFRQWRKKFNLGFSVDESSKLSASAYSGRVAIDIAQPVIGNS